jgi:hypothetical protein
VSLSNSLEDRRRRLAETIAWCNLQRLINKPIESEEIKQRRALGERAANHAFAAHQLESASLFKWINRKKVRTMQEEASRMNAEANLDEIRPLGSQLRTPALTPESLFQLGQTENARESIVHSIGDARAALLRQPGQSLEWANIQLAGGKILRYTPRGKTADHSPGYESKGFLDNESAPPWDTWVCMASGWLVAYVPRVLCELAQRGIEVDSVDCIRWADDDLLARTFGTIAR